MVVWLMILGVWLLNGILTLANKAPVNKVDYAMVWATLLVLIGLRAFAL